MTHEQLAVVAIGGNALISSPDKMSIPDQYRMVCDIAVHVASMTARGWNVLVTHGNGPQVGFIMRRSELSMPHVDPVPMDYAGADIQGAVGYMFAKALRHEFKKLGLSRKPVAVIAQTLVDPDDPAFAAPSKPIGSWFEKAEAERLAAAYGWNIVEDSGRGWRRMVPSPKPKGFVELSAIQDLVRAGYTVITLGGGGIPVVEEADGSLRGVEVVIDKDYASALLAKQLDAALLMLPTAVPRVALDFGKPTQRWVDSMTTVEARAWSDEGQFPPGSMQPKVLALTEFVEATGNTGVITDIASMPDALEGRAGTRIIRA